MREYSKKTLNLYFKSLNYEQELKSLTEHFQDINLDLKKFEEIAKRELSDFEKDIILQYHVNNKSLKKLALEYGYSYSYMRKVYMDAKEKLRIIMSVNLQK